MIEVHKRSSIMFVFTPNYVSYNNPTFGVVMGNSSLADAFKSLVITGEKYV